MLFAWVALQQAPSLLQTVRRDRVLAGIALVRADETAIDEVPAPEPVPV